jgi:Zn-dependent M28 family amino/carboxypeptidase
MVRRFPPFALFLALGLLAVAASAGTLALPSADSLARDVAALADPAMEGRASGTPGGDRAAALIAKQLEVAGARPGGDASSFFQSFVLSTGIRVAPSSRFHALAPEERQLELDTEWRPHGGSRSGEVTGDVVFVGYGITDGRWDDYHGVDVRGRIALALDGVPRAGGPRAVTRLEKLIAARRAGASALVIASDALPAVDATSAPVALTSAHVTRAAADALLAPSGETTSRLAEAIAERRAPASFTVPGRRVSIDVALEREERRAVNVIGVLPGTDPALADEAVVVGAHYDHVGIIGGQIHHGADDNASGTAMVLGLARAFAAVGGAPRTLVFALFGAEEIGLIGSRHYVRAPTVPIERTVAMVNLDMVGRLQGGELSVTGVDSGSGIREVVTDAARAAGVRVKVGGDPYSPSDHLRFYRAGTPVLFFHTGRHADYHRPTDTADRIDAAGMARVAAVAAHAIDRLARGPAAQYVKLDPPSRASRTARSGSAFFGIVADPRGGADGLRLADVLPGSAAERAGVREGDVIVRFAGEPVTGFEDVRRLIEKKKPGDTVDVVFLREGKDRTASAALDVRP